MPYHAIPYLAIPHLTLPIQGCLTAITYLTIPYLTYLTLPYRTLLTIPYLTLPYLAYTGVFDGHGAVGHVVSAFCKKKWPENMDKALMKAETQNPGLGFRV